MLTLAKWLSICYTVHDNVVMHSTLTLLNRILKGFNGLIKIYVDKIV